ncbi:hypothetical protein [Spiroplasma poulsonii]|uniref:hypothetical protein n=1 Tax=Spiroplasma poulsonii TaxID=2138 RepID=UPI001F4CB26A|nr:hypothetical protein [Spiroplasma poulsonii]UNF62586.1 hypothetical protein MNU24_03780 [Spiroplasma poulsonii]
MIILMINHIIDATETPIQRPLKQSYSALKTHDQNTSNYRTSPVLLHKSFRRKHDYVFYLKNQKSHQNTKWLIVVIMNTKKSQ